MPEDDNAFPGYLSFSILAHIGGVEPLYLELIVPGKVFSSHLSANQGQYFRLDVMEASETAMILFDSDHPSMQADLSIISGSRVFATEAFDAVKFGVRINSIRRFKKKNCKMGDCLVQVYVSAQGPVGGRFSLAYTIDSMPIELKEGDFLNIPNEFEQYFVYQALSPEPISFTISSESPCVVFSKPILHKYSIKEELTDRDFSFKTNIEPLAQIVYPASLMAGPDNRLIGFLYQPKFVSRRDVDVQTGNEYYILVKGERASVKVVSKVSRLPAYLDVVEQCQKDEFKYYYFENLQHSSFSLIFSVLSGHAELFLSPGRDTLPHVGSYWKKSKGLRGSEVSISSEDFKGSQAPQDTFSVSIQCLEHSQFTLVFTPSFKGIYKVHF